MRCKFVNIVSFVIFGLSIPYKKKRMWNCWLSLLYFCFYQNALCISILKQICILKEHHIHLFTCFHVSDSHQLNVPHVFNSITIVDVSYVWLAVEIDKKGTTISYPWREERGGVTEFVHNICTIRTKQNLNVFAPGNLKEDV